MLGAALVCGGRAPQLALILLQAWALADPDWPPLRPLLTIRLAPDRLEALAQFGWLVLGPLAAAAGALGTWFLLRAQAHGRKRGALCLRGMLGGTLIGALTPWIGVVVMDVAGSERDLLRVSLGDVRGPLTVVAAATGLAFGGALALGASWCPSPGRVKRSGSGSPP